MTSFEIKPFAVSVDGELLGDLRDRLLRTRWPDQLEGAGWKYGANLDYMLELSDYWAHSFDWRAEERKINSFANFRAHVGRVGIHLIHERGRGPDPLPLLITHGWPSSIYEMLDLIPLLADPASHGGDPVDAFDVIVPSIPGYGFSDRPLEQGFDYRRVANLWTALMEGLGYTRFGAHAYDIGASILTHVLLDHDERLVGYHTTTPENPAPYLGAQAPELTAAEMDYERLTQQWEIEEGGYMALQTTRPQTLAYGLNDSPAGMAAWMLEKWWAWTGPPSGSLEGHFTKDQLLANVTIYWVTQTMNSANRLYYERAHAPRPRTSEDRITVPLGVALTATQAIERPPREYVARLFTDIRSWVELPRGGHFIALEHPNLVASSIRDFFRPLR